MTLLVVDDSRIMRNLIKNYFTDLDLGHCDFVDADNGEDAFKLVQSRPVDLVFLDWNMPKMSGIDFLKQIRNIDAFKRLPIIMVTSEISKNNVIEALKNGATDYIIKPIDEKLFKEKVIKVLRKK
ncbi:MAG: response regulator [Spirochaetaceae bacterium]|jgi:two-component system chemotaxis response regulator CheY|nr:response regulator [Spirochaetaceae bacterium]